MVRLSVCLSVWPCSMHGGISHGFREEHKTLLIPGVYGTDAGGTLRKLPQCFSMLTLVPHGRKALQQIWIRAIHERLRTKSAACDARVHSSMRHEYNLSCFFVYY